jgi:class 3 adenylate cyclase/tetratricopeptide (TPR) repeat protein
MVDSPAVSEVARAAQRRQLTVLFCDLVDSTPLAQALDPEDMADVYRAFRDLCAATIEAAGGYVAKYMGDGVLAYFGYPTAHEDAAERAVHAGVRLVRGASALRASHDAPLAARVGIATGLVVVGDLVGEHAAEARDVVGETPNLAARLQGAAAPGEILVSSRTQRLAAGLFAFEDAGHPALKGIKLKEPVWRVRGARLAADRFRARRGAAHAPMVGRAAELETLLEAWRACQGGASRIVGVVGEAGIGKSRLVDEFHRRITRAPHIWLEGSGVQIFANTPFYAVAQTIHRRLAAGPLVSPAERRARLEESLRSVDAYSDEALGLIAELVDVAPEPATLAPGSEQRRRALIDALCDWLIKSAQRWPTVLAIEDLQWVDPSSLEFLETLAARAGSAPLLVLYTARPEAPWPNEPAHQNVTLGRLDRESVRNLVVAASPSALAADLIERLVAQADGVPLFAEELARLAGADADGGAAIPSALSDLLMARLDQLGRSKELAQIAAVLGGQVPRPLLGVVSGLGEEDFAKALQALVAADVLVASEAGDEPAFAFRHTLIEAAAYETLLKRLRRTLHKRAARAMLERYPEMADRQPEVLAQHWLRAGEQAEAIAAWRRAARLAFERFAFREAQHACEEGLALIRTLKPTAETDEIELSLQNMLAEAARTVEGYASPRARAAVQQARVIVERTGGLQGQLRQAFGEWTEASTLGDYAAEAEPGDRFVALAHIGASPSVLGSAHMILMTRYRQGDLAAAEAAYQAGKPYFEHPEFLRRAGAAPQALGNAASIAWLMGRHEEAERRNAEMLLVSSATGNPYDEAYALYFAAHHAVRSRTPEEAEQVSLRAIRIAQLHGYAAIAASMGITLGRARAGLGQAAEAAAMMDRWVHERPEVRRRSLVTMYLTWLAEAYAMADEAARAGAAVEEALSINPPEIFFRPEALRLRGDLRRGEGRLAEARADYEAALAQARSMGAEALVQRAEASLAAVARADSTLGRGWRSG